MPVSDAVSPLLLSSSFHPERHAHSGRRGMGSGNNSLAPTPTPRNMSPASRDGVLITLLNWDTGWPKWTWKTFSRLNSGTSGSSWAATVATCCPGRMAEHPKSNSIGGFPRPLGPPCTFSPMLVQGAPLGLTYG